MALAVGDAISGTEIVSNMLAPAVGGLAHATLVTHAVQRSTAPSQCNSIQQQERSMILITSQ